MKIEIDKKILLTMQLFKGRTDVRYYLNGIFFGADGEVAATNGRVLVVSQHENKIKNDIIINVIDKPKVTRFDKAIIDTETLIVEYVNVFNDKNVRVALGMCEVIDGRYPDYKCVIPQSKKACDEVGFYAGYLSLVEKAAKLFNPKWQSIKLELNGADGAALANISSPDGKSCKIIIMPMRL